MDKRPPCTFADLRVTTVFCSGTMKLYPVEHCEKCPHYRAKPKAKRGWR